MNERKKNGNGSYYTPTIPQASMAKPDAIRKAALKLVDDLASSFVEREEIVRGMLLGIVSGYNVFIWGPPGTGKSLLARNFALAINGAKYFETQMHGGKTPEALFGPSDPEAHLQDAEIRYNIRGMLPDSNIAMIDEPFRANNVVLDSLLPLFNERHFQNGPDLIQTPLRFVVSGSNSVPDDQDLEAIWDRFVLRFVGGNVKDRRGFFKYACARQGKSPKPPKTILTIEDFVRANEEAAKVKVTSVSEDAITACDEKLMEKGFLLSERTWMQAINVMKANAWIEGRDEVTEEDLVVLAHIAWDDPKDAKVVEKLVNGIANPLNERALKFLDTAETITRDVETRKDGETDSTYAVRIADGATKLKSILQRLRGIIGESPASRTTKLREIDAKIAVMQKRIKEKAGDLLGI